MHPFAILLAILSGNVTDPQGRGVPAAQVTLTARDSSVRLVTRSDSAGAYRFDDLPAAEYVLEAEAAGFATFTKAPVRTARGADVRLDIPLQVAGVEQQVVVTASGTPQTADEISKAVTAISDTEIEQRDEFALPEALRTVPGLRVQQLGGPGALISIKTRGLRNSDTAVLIDGLRLRDPTGPQADASGLLQDLTVTDVSQVEVLRGAGSALYGTNAIGGVINIVTDEGGGRPRGNVLMEGGSLGMLRGRAQTAGGLRGDRIQYSAGLAHLNVINGVHGDNPARTSSAQGMAGFRLGAATQLTTRLYSADSFMKLNSSPEVLSGVPASGIIDAVPGATFLPAADDPDYSRAARFFSGAVRLTSHPTQATGYSVQYQGLTTWSSYRNGPAGVGFQPLTSTRNDYDGRIHTLNARVDRQLGPSHLVDAGYEFEDESYHSRADAATVDVSQRSHTLFAQDQVRLFGERLQVAGAFRAQWFLLEQPGFAPAAAAPYQGMHFAAPPSAYTGDGSAAWFFRGSGTKLRAHVGRGYRAPSLYERFGASFSSFGYSAYGDPRLRPERSIAVDGGIDQAFRGNRVRLSGTYFYTRLQEVIIFDFSGAIQPALDPFGRFGGYRNTGGGLARGVELSGALAPTRSLDLTAAYTYTNARERRPLVGDILRSFVIPEHQLSLNATQRIGPRLLVNFDFIGSSNYLAPVFDPNSFASRAFRFEGIAQGDLAVSYRVPLSEMRALRLFSKVGNLFNRTYYESGFLTPRATAVGGLQLEF